MYNIVLNGVTKRYDYLELIREFFDDDGFEIHCLEEKVQGSYISQNELDRRTAGLSDKLEFDFRGDKEQLKREIYERLSGLTGTRPPWGILTGVRPVKLAGMYEDPYTKLRDEFLVSDEKVRKVLDIYDYQASRSGMPEDDSISIYAGIPFCPTRCRYCSFTSYQPKKGDTDRYLEALIKEIEQTAHLTKGRKIETIYIGGGTPTTLEHYQLNELLSCIRENLDLSSLKEFTVEAGRPDTITVPKLDVLRKHGVGRISINPQSMDPHTLELIGRVHTPEMIRDAFEMADGFDINSDCIAGLPEEGTEELSSTINELIDLGADNITVHTLSVKNASIFKDTDPYLYRRQAKTVNDMICASEKLLAERGFRPYYLYRQKHMAGNLENTGYCKDDKYCLYNIRIMEEKQTLIAFGAGGISKVYHKDEDRLERVPNVSNFEVYTDRIDEMIERKERGIC